MSLLCIWYFRCFTGVFLFSASLLLFHLLFPLMEMCSPRLNLLIPYSSSWWCVGAQRAFLEIVFAPRVSPPFRQTLISLLFKTQWKSNHTDLTPAGAHNPSHRTLRRRSPIQTAQINSGLHSSPPVSTYSSIIIWFGLHSLNIFIPFLF